MSSTFDQANQSHSADLLGRLKRFIFDHDHTSSRAMVFASVTAAAVIGAGILSVAQSNASIYAPQSAMPAEVDSDLALALNAAFSRPATDTALAAVLQSAPDIDTASLTGSERAQPAAATAMVMNNVLASTAGLTGPQSLPRPASTSSWTAALIPASFHANRLAGVGTMVNAMEDVLPFFEEAVVEIRSGDTMMNLLTDIGIERNEAYYAIEAFGDVFDPRRIRAGQAFNVGYEVMPPIEQGSAEDQRRLLNFSMRTAPDREVMVHWDDESQDYVGEARDIELTERFTRGRATIDSSLYMAANGIGVPDAVTIELIRIFSHSVDFQRDIRDGDSFDVFYSRRYDEDDVAVMSGNIEYASLITRGREQALYRFTTEDDGDTDYYDEDGKSVRAFLMRTPIDGARITSSFGPRRHPVLGYNRMHKGVDFGAPTGTPIYAAGNGTIVRASRYGSYGNYVRIRHANGYETAYAHMNGYGPGIRSGARVQQGQIIGYVGATGRVTGAHLHYEVLYNDEQVNPRNIDLPSGRELEGEILEAFELERTRIQSAMALAPVLEVTATASAGGGSSDTPATDLSPQ